MPHMSSRLLLLAFVWLSIAACTAQSSPSAVIARQYKESNGASVNLGTAVPGGWEKVCILGPYSTNDIAKSTLGFEWDAEAKTSIQTKEGVSLLVFVQDNKVLTHIEHPRNQGDFSNLNTQCFSKEKAHFSYVQNPNKGWPGLFPKNGA